MVQFKKLGYAVLLFVGINAILYTHAFNDAAVVPRKGNVGTHFIISKIKKGGKAAIDETIRAASAGHPTAREVIRVASRGVGATETQ